MFLWLVRRFFYVLQHPSGALLGSGLYCLLCLGGIFFLHYIGRISPFSGFIIIGFASLISSVLVLIKLRGPNTRGIEFRGLTISSVLRAHWDYGRWFVGRAALAAFMYQAQIFLGAAFLGLEGAGVFRAMQNTALPMHQIVIAVIIFGIPILAVEFGRGNLVALRKKRFLLTAALTIAGCLFELTLLLSDIYLERLLYGGKFAPYAWVMPVLGLVPLFLALSSGCEMALRALQKPQYLFFSALAATPVVIVSTVLFTLWWGIGGLASSMALTYGISSLLTIYFYRVVSSNVHVRKDSELEFDLKRSVILKDPSPIA
jgi:O-antigen/teichoic acid export membrane protein